MPTPSTHLPKLIQLASSQGGHFLASQAIAAGVGKDDLARLAKESGPLERIHHGVYAIRKHDATFRSRVWAGMLVAGPGAIAVRRTVQRLRHMDGYLSYEPIDIFHPWARHQSDLFVRSRSVVLPEQVQVVHGILCSDDTTTIAQLGAVIDVERLERAVEWYLRTHGLAAYGKLVGRLGVRGSSGLLALREVLEKRPRDLPPTHSELETRFWQLLRGSKLIDRMPKRQVPIRDPQTGDILFFLDNGWMDLLLYAELDGVAAHTPARAVFHDRWRLNRLTSMLGLRGLRFTWDDVVTTPKRVVEEVAAAIRTADRTAPRG